ncbi:MULTISPECIES: hypothetical protein [Snodgrassella]|uniref:hypothetical protein n=1 Tax=Snodgrassella TaxID=1193515 RepID=UPI002269AD8D|nr:MULTISPECIES: hypothetical protein [unclassified Snodgrassella]MCT6882213.1 hypothetical protein [Snodgrassella alvi]MCX8746148.1 hypothetical protein [Snodgrassella sp. B3800]MCX8748051.1 hypothetical protein [Snodgrassella sp. B3088]MCX8752907.1 hypothetical protein [Snodgrassella sp. B3837]
MELIKNAFSVCILFALIGGLAGSLLVTDYKRYGWFMTILFVLLGMIFAAAVTDYFFPPNRPWLFAGVGVFAGMSTTSFLDAFKAAAPGLAKRIIDIVSRKAEQFVGHDDTTK